VAPAAEALAVAEYEPLPAPPPPSLDELADRVLEDPDAAEAHRALGEALLAAGERDRGREELELALGRYEADSDWVHAGDVLTELIRLDPVSIRLYQKRVELGFRMGDRGRLLEAYLELADCLVRVGSLEKAEAVYRRVLEHDPENGRARAALDTIAAPPAGPAPPAGYGVTPPTAPAPAAAPPTAEPGYVDLGAMVLEEQAPRADTRIRVEDEEPTGDEEADFRQILQQFKSGLERSLTADDFQTHYDLGIAFREMGLLDEAIAEFQKALRAPEGRLRTAEALGGCFFEKGQFPVAGAILRRAVETLPGADDEKIGLLYWLGRSEEEQGRGAEAVQHYQRALAVDIGFRDLNERLDRLAGRTA
jgi:tetratricopeptide (TPR) repeat protein